MNNEGLRSALSLPCPPCRVGLVYDRVPVFPPVVGDGEGEQVDPLVTIRGMAEWGVGGRSSIGRDWPVKGCCEGSCGGSKAQ